MFELEGVTYRLGERVLLGPLNLTLSAGRMVSLIGHNGSGKSTLIKLLARQLSPSTGEIRLDGKPLAAFKSREFARRVAYLPQQPPATDAMTVEELVALARYPWHGALGAFTSEDRRCCAEAIRQADVGAFAGRRVDSLSGGERQRVWLATLLAQNTRCLLLDEPTAALDIAHQVEVLQRLRHLCRALELTVLVVLHDINMAARYSDRLVALHGGHVRAQGCPDSIMQPATLESIYDVPMSVLGHPSTGQPVAVVG